jgi:hypothetical protein
VLYGRSAEASQSEETGMQLEMGIEEDSMDELAVGVAGQGETNRFDQSIQQCRQMHFHNEEMLKGA